MKIISKFKDYYDSVQGVLYDDEIKFIRRMESHKVDFKLPYTNLKMYCTLRYIGFCGKIYPMIRMTASSFDDDDSELAKYIKEHGRTDPTDKWSNSLMCYDIETAIPLCQSTRSYYSRARHYQKVNPDIKKTIARINEFTKHLESQNLFDKYTTPIFILEHKNRDLYLNSCYELKNYHFQQIMDPYTAYQELVMWIGNQAVMEYPPQITDDIVMRDKKGFDKWSFKTMPTKRKKR